jgi:hypothetical protein
VGLIITDTVCSFTDWVGFGFYGFWEDGISRLLVGNSKLEIEEKKYFGGRSCLTATANRYIIPLKPDL